MDNANGHTINLANSIIGVSILAMPYCFRQCGVLLSICLLLVSSIISRLACHFLLKSAIIARRKTFEFLAFHIFGSLGKFSIEIGMIGFLLGTCVAFFVVMGDLGPAILSEMTGVHIGNALRNSTLIALAVFCVLPLGLLKNVDSLNGVSTATIGFYCCLVLKIVIEALPHIFTGDWVSEVVLWRPAGILQCLPIFSMALFCQTQLFEIYQAIPNASLDKMNSVVRVAVNMCTWVYIFVGAFGYIAFFQKPFTGNILLSFVPSIASDVMKMGFVLSLAFSFPLVIFPCRASLYSLLYKGPSYVNLHDSGSPSFIPEGKFKMLTLFIVSVSLMVGIMIPSIELVLGLIGSTIGVMICVLFPVTCFICISPKNTNERILAQIMLFVGVIVMVLGTYANLQAVEEANLYPPVTEKLPPVIPEMPLKSKIGDLEKPVVIDIPTTLKIPISEDKKQKPPENPLKQADAPVVEKDKKDDSAKEVRHEPPQPEEPVENPVVIQTEKPAEIKKESKEKQEPVVEPMQPIDDKVEEQKKKLENKDNKQDSVAEVVEKIEAPETKNEESEKKKVVDEEDKQGPVVEPIQPNDEKIEEQQKEEVENVIKNTIAEKKPVAAVIESKPDTNVEKKEKKNDEVDIEAIKKEDRQLKEDEEKQEKDRNQILIDTIQKQNEVQKELVEQQKKLIEVIQKQGENVNKQDVDKVNEEKVKAVKQIEDIAKKAIETIGALDNKNAVAGEDNKQEKELNQEVRVAADIVPNVDVKKTEGKMFQDGNNQIADVNRRLEQEKMENPAPGFSQKEPEKKDNKISMIPLPIALAKLNNVTAESNKTVPKEESEIKNIRRDILAEDKSKIRSKREANDIRMENLVKEVCEEISKSPSTEKPIIKMLCKLSEPNLQTVDLGAMEQGNLPDLQPQKRDLKQFSEK